MKERRNEGRNEGTKECECGWMGMDGWMVGWDCQSSFRFCVKGGKRPNFLKSFFGRKQLLNGMDKDLRPRAVQFRICWSAAKHYLLTVPGQG